MMPWPLLRRLRDMNPVGAMGRSVAVLASGSVLAQCVTILGAPLLTRYFSPDEFGVFATFGALAALLGTANALSYHVAIPLAPDNQEAVALAFLACAVSAALFILLLLLTVAVLGTGHTVIAAVVGPAQALLWLVPLAVVTSAFYDTARLWNIREKHFLRLSGAEICQRVATLAMQVVAGIGGYGAAGLVLSTIGGTFLSFLALIIPSITNFAEQGRHLSLATVRTVSRTYRRLPLFTFPSSIVFSVGRYVPLLILPWFFGAGTTGLYALTERVLQTPMTFIGAHIQSVFLSSCAELKASGKLPNTALSLLETLVRLGMPTFAILAVVAPEAFALVFGEDWRAAGSFSQLLTPYIFCFLIALPLNSLPLAFNMQRGELLFQGGMALGRCAAVLIGSLSGRIDLTIALLSLIGAAGWLSYLLWAMALVGRHRMALSVLARECLFAIPFLLPVGLAKVVLSPDEQGWLLTVAAFCWCLSLLAVVLRTMRPAESEPRYANFERSR